MDIANTIKEYADILDSVEKSNLSEDNISHFKGFSTLHDVIPTTATRKARNPEVTQPHNQKKKSITVISNQKQITNYVTRNSKNGNLLASDKSKVIASLKNLKAISKHAKDSLRNSKARSAALNKFEKTIQQASGSKASNVELKTTK